MKDTKRFIQVAAPAPGLRYDIGSTPTPFALWSRKERLTLRPRMFYPSVVNGKRTRPYRKPAIPVTD